MNRPDYFYYSDASQSLNDPREIEQELADLGVKIVSRDEAFRIRFYTLFDSLRTTHQEYSDYECLPRSDLYSVPIPFDVGELNEHCVDGKTLETIVEDHINQSFSEIKFLFSGNPDHLINLEFKTFRFGIVDLLNFGRPNHTFVLFDEGLDRAMLFNFDLCITIFTRAEGRKANQLGGYPDEFWISYFNDNFVNGSTGTQHHLDVINCNYVPRLPGVKTFFFAS